MTDEEKIRQLIQALGFYAMPYNWKPGIDAHVACAADRGCRARHALRLVLGHKYRQSDHAEVTE